MCYSLTDKVIKNRNKRMTIFLTETDVRCFLRPGQNKERLKKY
ncbi:hypothetical protein BN128_1739 [Cronobacter sakazakii 696]|nr:hypothetical protein BN128_1739 [Cronobacter sakazakii 696]